MMLSSDIKFYLLLSMIFHLHLLVPVGEYNNQLMTNELTKILGRMKEGFAEPRIAKGGDISEEMLPLVMGHLSPALVQVARRELNETEEIRQKSLIELRKMIEAEENLASSTDDLFLLGFLRKYKFDVAKAFERVQDFWHFRTDNDYIFANLDENRMFSIFQKSSMGTLLHRDRGRCPILIVKLGMLDPDEDRFEDLILAGCGVMLYLMEQETTQVVGYRVIFDLRGFGWKHLKYIAPSNLKLLIRGTMILPLKLHRLHVVGETTVIRIFWGLASPFLPQNLKKIMTFHSEDFEPLHEVIHRSILPEEYGGLAPQFVTSMDIARENCDKVTGLLGYGYKN